MTVCRHNSEAPDNALGELHGNQGGLQRHKCAVCAYDYGYRRGKSGLGVPNGAEVCMNGLSASEDFIAQLPASQGTIARHRCCICAYHAGHARGSLLAKPSQSETSSKPSVRDVAIEARHTETFLTTPTNESIQSDRRESELVHSFCQFMKDTLGMEATRNEILLPEETAPLYTDVFVRGLNVLIEVKGTTARGPFRMAIGQIADYRRFLETPRCAILLPSKPSRDLLDLAAVEGIAVIWPSKSGFESTERLWDDPGLQIA